MLRVGVSQTEGRIMANYEVANSGLGRKIRRSEKGYTAQKENIRTVTHVCGRVGCRLETLGSKRCKPS